jgi:hypothetical protein
MQCNAKTCNAVRYGAFQKESKIGAACVDEGEVDCVTIRSGKSQTSNESKSPRASPNQWICSALHGNRNREATNRSISHVTSNKHPILQSLATIQREKTTHERKINKQNSKVVFDLSLAKPINMLVLFETPAGYSLFKVRNYMFWFVLFRFVVSSCDHPGCACIPQSAWTDMPLPLIGSLLHIHCCYSIRAEIG